MNVEIKSMSLLSPAPGRCPECATVHAPEDPHNKRSLYYQMRFGHEHGRWPTWEDALAHCTPEVQAAWRAELTERGEVLL